MRHQTVSSSGSDNDNDRNHGKLILKRILRTLRKEWQMPKASAQELEPLDKAMGQPDKANTNKEHASQATRQEMHLSCVQTCM